MTVAEHPPVIAAPALDVPGLRHAFFTREGGVSRGDYASLNCGPGSRDAAADVAENRRRAADALAVPHHRLVTMHQTHSADVLTVREPPTTLPRVDGLVTATPGVAIGALSADCAPILFADPAARVIGAAHSGWRGAVKGIGEATIDAMVALGAERARIRAVIGPTIAGPSYEVGPELVAEVTAASPDCEDLFRPAERPGHHLFDLPGYIVRRLTAAGISVDDMALDTYADEARFFSYRRGTHRGAADYGRLLSAIVLS